VIAEPTVDVEVGNVLGRLIGNTVEPGGVHIGWHAPVDGGRVAGGGEVDSFERSAEYRGPRNLGGRLNK
jgi:hypothetical protein